MVDGNKEKMAEGERLYTPPALDMIGPLLHTRVTPGWEHFVRWLREMCGFCAKCAALPQAGAPGGGNPYSTRESGSYDE